MLATLYARPFSTDNWLYELKYDGYRCLARKEGSCVDLISRQGNRMNTSFPDIVESLAAMPGNFTVDAELTVDDESGRPSFARLQKRARTKVPMRVRAAVREHPARLYVFELLTRGNQDYRPLPLRERKQYLRELADYFNAQQKTLVYASGVEAEGEAVFRVVRELCFEGMVAKRLDARYERGRSPAWLKIKNPDYDRPAALGFRKRAL
jgi:bifunctional non-homologous end joining protein LigD